MKGGGYNKSAALFLKDDVMKLKSVLVDENTFSRTLKRIAHEIIEKNSDLENLCLVGIKTRGVPLAKRISKYISEIENKNIDVGTLDITLYRDDIDAKENPIVNETDISFDVSKKNIVLVDDVIYTGRTVRAALDAVMSFGRPAKIQLAVFVDRGHRELPIRADYVGKNIPTSKNELVHVGVKEYDGKDVIELYEK